MLDRLTMEEVYALTKRKRYSAQFRVLNALGIPARPDGDGVPIVLRSAVETVLGLKNSRSESTKRTEPDFSSLDKPTRPRTEANPDSKR